MRDIRQKEIAVVGVSADTSKYGYKIFTSLRKNGFKVAGVNPKLAELEGERIYPRLSDLPVKPELVITVVPPSVTLKVVEETVRLGIGELWMQPGSESEEAVRAARAKGIAVTYNACFMTGSGVW